MTNPFERGPERGPERSGDRGKCLACDGTGKIGDKTCQSCGGTGKSRS